MHIYVYRLRLLVFWCLRAEEDLDAESPDGMLQGEVSEGDLGELRPRDVNVQAWQCQKLGLSGESYESLPLASVVLAPDNSSSDKINKL